MSLKNLFHKKLVWIIAYFLIGFAIYGHSLNNSFIWDDEEQIINNAAVHSVENIPSYFKGSTFNSGGTGTLHGIYYKPLMVTSYSLLWSSFGNSSFAFHLIQLILHIGSCIFLAYFLESLFSMPLAWGFSLIYLVHPLNVECVTYCADLQDTLFFFFGILSLLLLSNANEPLKASRLLLISFFLLLSLFSKESGILFLPILVLYSLLFRIKSNSWKRVTLSASLAFGTYCIFRFGIADLGIRTSGLQPIALAPLSDRLLTLPRILFYYLSNFIFPIELAVSQHWVVRAVDWNHFVLPLLFDLSFLGILSFLVIRFWHEKRWLFFAFWVLLGLALHSQIFPLDMTVADRWFYFPMAGIIGLLALSIEKLTPFQHLKKLPALMAHGPIVVFVICTLLLSIRSYFRAENWKDDPTLYLHDVAINPEAFDLQHNAGIALFRLGDYVQAKAHFVRSIELAPHWWINWNSLGAVFQRLGDDASAQSAYLRSIENGPYHIAFENFAAILLKQGKIATLKNFLEKSALVHFPNNSVFIELEKAIRSHTLPSNEAY